MGDYAERDLSTGREVGRIDRPERHIEQRGEPVDEDKLISDILDQGGSMRCEAWRTLRACGMSNDDIGLAVKTRQIQSARNVVSLIEEELRIAKHHLATLTKTSRQHLADLQSKSA